MELEITRLKYAEFRSSLRALATVTKSLKKEIIKNHLLGLDEDENLSKLSSSGEHVDHQTIREVIDEFGSEIEKNGVDAAKSYGVSRFANELAEVARFKRKNEIELEDMMRGAKIARVLKNYGAGIPELEQFLSVIYSRAAKKGYDAESIVEQVSALSSLEKKHNANFDDLKSEFESLGSEIKSRQESKRELDQEIVNLKKQKTELLKQNEVDEGEMHSYTVVRERLGQLGLDVGSLEAVKEFLVSVKNEGFDSVAIISKLNSIGELGRKEEKVKDELTRVQSELEKNRDLLNETLKLEQSRLSVEQVENLRKTAEKISSSRGIDPSKAYAQFEEDIVSNYDAMLGMKAVLERLQESQKRLMAETDTINQQLAAEQTVHSEKVKRLEQEYSKFATELEKYRSLAEIGVDGKKIATWHEIIDNANLDFASVEAELKKNANLKSMEREITQKVAMLTTEAISLKESIEQLNQEKLKIESTIKALGDSAMAELNSVNSTILSSIADLNEGAKSTVSQIIADNEKALNDFRVTAQEGTQRAIGEATVDLKTNLSQLSSSVVGFSNEFRRTLEEASPQIKSLTVALEAGEKLGKYRNIMPLLKLLDEENVKESEALIAMWNVVNRFNAWINEHYRSAPKPEIAETLTKLVTSLNEEIQRINE